MAHQHHAVDLAHQLLVDLARLHQGQPQPQVGEHAEEGHEHHGHAHQPVVLGREQADHHQRHRPVQQLAGEPGPRAPSQAAQDALADVHGQAAARVRS